MATVLNRTSKALIESVDTNEYSAVDWLINPNLTAVEGFATKYWTIIGDTVLLMTPAERAAVDAADLSALRDSIAAQMDAAEDYARAFALVMLDEINLHASRVTDILNAVDNAASLSALKTAVALIPDVPQRTVAQLKTALRNKLGT